MQTISKIQTQNLLNSFSGAYREIFFEKSASARLILLNGQIEPLSYSESSGFSVLSRIGEKQVFAAYGSLDRIEKDVQDFGVSNRLGDDIIPCELSGLDEYRFVERNLSEALLPFGEYLRKLAPIGAEYDFVASYEVSVNLMDRSYIVGNSL